MGRTGFVIFTLVMVLGVFLAGATLLAVNHAASQADRETYTIGE